mgnify:CR=1 FL=1|tara:strand:+ start:1080 stop:1496 length:417 start_codon:yes stop_codon:yes gene_type:complete
MSELELDELADKIFYDLPKPKFSIQIQFDTYNVKSLFESLLTLTTNGMRIKFGNNVGKVNLSDLSSKDLENFNKYMNSFGINLIIEIEKFNPLLKNYDNLKYNNYNITDKTELKELKFLLLEGENVYLISFDYLREFD